jgi:hypothetical protein
LKDRAALAEWIVESLDDLSEAEVDALWAEEAERRLDEMERGQVREIPAKKYFAEPGPPSRETDQNPPGC